MVWILWDVGCIFFDIMDGYLANKNHPIDIRCLLIFEDVIYWLNFCIYIQMRSALRLRSAGGDATRICVEKVLSCPNGTAAARIIVRQLYLYSIPRI